MTAGKVVSKRLEIPGVPGRWTRGSKAREEATSWSP